MSGLFAKPVCSSSKRVILRPRRPALPVFIGGGSDSDGNNLRIAAFVFLLIVDFRGELQSRHFGAGSIPAEPRFSSRGFACRALHRRSISGASGGARVPDSSWPLVSTMSEAAKPVRAPCAQCREATASTGGVLLAETCAR